MALSDLDTQFENTLHDGGNVGKSRRVIDVLVLVLGDVQWRWREAFAWRLDRESATEGVTFAGIRMLQYLPSISQGLLCSPNFSLSASFSVLCLLP